MSTGQNPIDALYVAACLEVADDPQAAQIVRELDRKYRRALDHLRAIRDECGGREYLLACAALEELEASPQEVRGRATASQIKRADELYGGDDIEVDAEAVVVPAGAQGCWIQGWLWLSNEEAL